MKSCFCCLNCVRNTTVLNLVESNAFVQAEFLMKAFAKLLFGTTEYQRRLKSPGHGIEYGETKRKFNNKSN